MIWRTGLRCSDHRSGALHVTKEPAQEPHLPGQKGADGRRLRPTFGRLPCPQQDVGAGTRGRCLPRLHQQDEAIGETSRRSPGRIVPIGKEQAHVTVRSSTLTPKPALRRRHRTQVPKLRVDGVELAINPILAGPGWRLGRPNSAVMANQISMHSFPRFEAHRRWLGITRPVQGGKS